MLAVFVLFSNKDDIWCIAEKSMSRALNYQNNSWLAIHFPTQEVINVAIASLPYNNFVSNVVYNQTTYYAERTNVT